MAVYFWSKLQIYRYLWLQMVKHSIEYLVVPLTKYQKHEFLLNIDDEVPCNGILFTFLFNEGLCNSILIKTFFLIKIFLGNYFRFFFQIYERKGNRKRATNLVNSCLNCCSTDDFKFFTWKLARTTLYYMIYCLAWLTTTLWNNCEK